VPSLVNTGKPGAPCFIKFCAGKFFTFSFLIWPGWPAVYILYVFFAVASISSGPTEGIAQDSPGGAAWHKDSTKVPKSTSGSRAKGFDGRIEADRSSSGGACSKDSMEVRESTLVALAGPGQGSRGTFCSLLLSIQNILVSRCISKIDQRASSPLSEWLQVSAMRCRTA
jgi:hypothetical protein